MTIDTSPGERSVVFHGSATRAEIGEYEIAFARQRRPRTSWQAIAAMLRVNENDLRRVSEPLCVSPLMQRAPIAAVPAPIVAAPNPPRLSAAEKKAAARIGVRTSKASAARRASAKLPPAERLRARVLKALADGYEGAWGPLAARLKVELGAVSQAVFVLRKAGHLTAPGPRAAPVFPRLTERGRRELARMLRS